MSYGVGNDVTSIGFLSDMSVLVVGAGAFAAENVRTAFDHGAD